MGLFIVAPCVGLVWLGGPWEPGAGVVRVLLLFVSLPVYAVYVGIYVKRFFPERALGALRWLVPFLLNSLLSLWLFGGDSLV
ncbi:MAG: hypothetical protein QF464_24000, partial [Myxococcota bacterium]|nr:hypothetical protein [Myxococcota bacterium]